MSDWKHLAPGNWVPVLGKRIEQREMLERVCVRPPYFTLDDLSWEGEVFRATASAEAPALGEHGPMTAAELGRHAAIAGLCRAALEQTDGSRRYYLARRASCHYRASPAPYGSVVTFAAALQSLDKRHAQLRVEAAACGQLLATFELSYAVLTEATFGRLFQHRSAETPDVTATPYDRLLACPYTAGEGWREQRFVVPAAACAGHFEGYPALPVAVLMGQLSYLAGRECAEAGQRYRVLEGQIEASDLCWAGEEIALRAKRVAQKGLEQVHLCTARVGEREVGRMTLRLERDAALSALN